MLPGSTPMLFAPPEPPLALPSEATVVIGRSRDCDLRLPDTDASRRHAKIVCEAGRFVLHDLGSTNGTFVNDEPVAEPRELEPGDRIRVGATTVTFCRVDAGSVSAVEGMRTAVADPALAAAGVEAFRGDLAEIPPYAVLQILELGRKTGRLEIDAPDRCGRLWLRGGEPIHAEAPGQIGFDAAISLVRASLGRFAFEPGEAPVEPTIEASVTDLLLESARRLDEGL